MCLFTDWRQVSHHEEGCKRGVKEEGNPFCRCSRDAQTAYAGCVCCRYKKARRVRAKMQVIIQTFSLLQMFERLAMVDEETGSEQDGAVSPECHLLSFVLFIYMTLLSYLILS